MIFIIPDDNIYVIPDNTEILIIGDRRKKYVENIPISVKTLIVGRKYDEDLNLPKNLKTLILGKYYTRSLDFRLVNYCSEDESTVMIETLLIGRHYSKTLYLPSSIKNIYIENNHMLTYGKDDAFRIPLNQELIKNVNFYEKTK